MTKTLGRGPTRSQRTLIVLAVVALLASLITVYVPLPAQADSSSNPNNTEYWENLYPDASECIKYGATGSNEHGSSDGSAVTLNSGFEFVVLIVKGGSVDYGDGPGNAVYENPQAGVAYYPPDNGGGQVAGVSHWIVCTGEIPEEPEEASVDVRGACVEDEFHVTIETENATVSVDLNGDGDYDDAGESGLTGGSHEVTAEAGEEITWLAVADDGAEFDEDVDEIGGEITVEKCEPDGASVDVRGACDEDDFVITITAENATVDIDLNGDGILQPGEMGLGSGEYEYTGDDENWVPWSATATDDAEFENGKTSDSGEIYIEECVEDNIASIEIGGECVDEGFVVSVDAEHATVSIDLDGDGSYGAGETGLPSGSYEVTAEAGEDISWLAVADKGAEFDEDVDELEGEVTVEDCEEPEVLASIVITVSGTCVLEGDSGHGEITVTIPVDGGATVVITDEDDNEIATLTESGTVDVPEGATYSWSAEAGDGFEFPPGFEDSGEIDIVECSVPEVQASVLVTVTGVCLVAGDDGQGRITVDMSVDGAATVVITDKDDKVVATLTEPGTVTVAEGATYSWEAEANEGFEFPVGFNPEGQVVIAKCSQPEELPFTGVESEPLVAIATTLLALGVVLLISTRRREEF